MMLFVLMLVVYMKEISKKKYSVSKVCRNVQKFPSSNKENWWKRYSINLILIRQIVQNQTDPLAKIILFPFFSPSILKAIYELEFIFSCDIILVLLYLMIHLCWELAIFLSVKISFFCCIWMLTIFLFANVSWIHELFVIFCIVFASDRRDFHF